jgi:hypothetical protein
MTRAIENFDLNTAVHRIIEQGEDGPHRIGNSVQFIYYTLAAVRRENYKDMNSFGPFFKFS